MEILGVGVIHPEILKHCGIKVLAGRLVWELIGWYFPIVVYLISDSYGRRSSLCWSIHEGIDEI